jgi:predicted TIM-barrel fold metal-dependent hydrolase
MTRDPLWGGPIVEAEWNPMTPIDETRYASGLGERYGLPSAIVAQTWLDRDDVRMVVAGQAAFPLVRGVRHKPGGRRRQTLSEDSARSCPTRLGDAATRCWNSTACISTCRRPGGIWTRR